MTKPPRSSYWVAGAISGVVWFIVAAVLDSDWAIPKSSWSFLATGALAGAMTGEVISILFRRAFGKKSKILFFTLPFATLPVAIALFAGLVWLMRQSLGIRFQPATPRLTELRLIVETYLIVLLTIFAPFLYALALLNQRVMRFILERQMPNQSPDRTPPSGVGQL